VRNPKLTDLFEWLLSVWLDRFFSNFSRNTGENGDFWNIENVPFVATQTIVARQ